jgi:hypothetical protein
VGACLAGSFFLILGTAVAFDFAFSVAATRSDLAPARWRRPFLAWLDGTETRWAIPLLLVAFIAV